jgi:hypothetical protein
MPAVYPPANQVLAGTTYGPNGNDYTGTLTYSTPAEIAAATLTAFEQPDTSLDVINQRVEVLRDNILTPDDIANAVWAYGDRRVTDGRIVQALRTQVRTREIRQGDTYGTNARSFAVQASDGGEWPVDLSDYEWACTFALLGVIGTPGTPAAVGMVSVSQATGDSRALVVNLTAAETAALATGKYRYEVTGTDGDVVWTVERGMAEVIT